MPNFSFGDAKNSGQEGMQTNTPQNLTPPSTVNENATTPDVGVQGIGPSAIPSGTPGIEPAAPTGVVPLVSQGLDLTDEEFQLIVQRRKDKGMLSTDALPTHTPLNPRLPGG